MTSTAELNTDILKETYIDLQKIVYDQAHKKSRLFHMPYEDALSLAHSAFVKAVNNYDPSKGAKISTWVTFCLHNDLINYLKKEYRHYSYEPLEEEYHGGDNINHFVQEFTEGLSDEAKQVVMLLLETPDELSNLMQWDGVRNKTGTLKTLKNYLLDMGWVASEIKETITEIRQALQPSRRSTDDVLIEHSTNRRDFYCYAKTGMVRKEIKNLTDYTE